jgi:hypothetical protein
MLLGLAGVAVCQTHDVTAPVLTAFSVSPSSVDARSAPAPVTFAFSATDDLSGVGSVSVRIAGPGSPPVVLGDSVSAGGGLSASGSVVVVLPQYSASGGWTVTGVTVVDVAGNRAEYSTAALSAAGFGVGFVAQ